MATEDLLRSSAPAVTAAALARVHGSVGAEIALRLGDGRRLHLPAWRSRCDRPHMPAIGNLRLAARAPADADAAAAQAMALQCAAFGLPYGGACGGIAAPAGALSPRALQAVWAAYARAFPDMVLGGPCAGAPGTVTPALPGMPQSGPRRDEAVAWTAFAALARLLPRPGTWVLEGRDPAAPHLARLLHAAGWRLVAAADDSGAVENRLGLSPSELACAAAMPEGLAGLAGERGTLRIAAARQVRADLLVLAGEARLDAVAAAGLSDIAAVAELAPQALSAGAEALLLARGCRVLPEIVAGAGAPILAHLRCLQRRHRRGWTAAELKARLLRRFDEGLEAIGSQGNLRAAAAGRAHDFTDALRRGAAVVPL